MLPSPLSPRGRLAPSPTGHLHLGNAWAFVLAWLAARSAGGSVVLRMEDIDPDRSREAYAAAIVEDLHWLGLDWDGDVTVQSHRLDTYTRAMQLLEAAGHLYPCYCTRKELRTLAGAPHVDDTGAPYPGLCRDLSQADRARLQGQGRRPAWRLRCPPAHDPAGRMDFVDGVYGPQSFTLAECGGDFALRRSDGVFAYQLAVVLDDAATQVTQIVRGRDILVSTPRQIWLQTLLGLPRPTYAHIPLLLDEQGERLAKRHQSLSLRALREAGTRPEAVMGLLAHLARLRQSPSPCRVQELCVGFSLATLPRADIPLTAELAACLMRP